MRRAAGSNTSHSPTCWGSADGILRSTKMMKLHVAELLRVSVHERGHGKHATQAKSWIYLIPRPSWSSSASCTQSGSRCMRSGSASWTSSAASIIWFVFIPKVAQRPENTGHGPHVNCTETS